MSKELLMKLRSKVPDTRYDALVNMTINSSEETVEEVCRIICSDIDPQCIEKGIEILPYFKNLSREKKINVILGALNHRVIAVKQSAVKALRNLKVKNIQQVLLNILEFSKNELLKIEVIEAIQELGDKDSTRVLRKSLVDKSRLVRGYSATALSLILKEEAIPILKHALINEKSQWTRSYLLGELILLGEEHYLHELIDLLNSKQYLVRGTTADILGGVKSKMNNKIIQKALEKALSQESSPYPIEKMTQSLQEIN